MGPIPEDLIVFLIFGLFVLVQIVRAQRRKKARRAAVPPTAPVELSTAPHSKLLNELSGSLIGAPAGSDVELALLEVDRRDQPDRLLSNVQLKGRGSELPFILQFNPDTFRPGQRVELRGRVTRAGQLIMRLPSRSIASPASQGVRSCLTLFAAAAPTDNRLANADFAKIGKENLPASWWTWQREDSRVDNDG
mgnify:CR=1 FL=1